VGAGLVLGPNANVVVVNGTPSAPLVGPPRSDASPAGDAMTTPGNAARLVDGDAFASDSGTGGQSPSRARRVAFAIALATVALLGLASVLVLRGRVPKTAQVRAAKTDPAAAVATSEPAVLTPGAAPGALSAAATATATGVASTTSAIAPHASVQATPPKARGAPKGGQRPAGPPKPASVAPPSVPPPPPPSAAPPPANSANSGDPGYPGYLRTL
jgi:hypothetical protein